MKTSRRRASADESVQEPEFSLSCCPFPGQLFGCTQYPGQIHFAVLNPRPASKHAVSRPGYALRFARRLVRGLVALPKREKRPALAQLDAEIS